MNWLTAIKRAAKAALFCFYGLAVAQPPALLDCTCEVVGIMDGDTFKARCPYEQVKVRFAAIDAPESKQAFGQVSRKYLSQLIFGKQVHVTQTKTDVYGRIVANVYGADEQDVGLLMVRAGLAWHYKRYASEQTPAARQTYAAAEHQARENKLGLWRDPHPVPPWDWRHTQ